MNVLLLSRILPSDQDSVQGIFVIDQAKALSQLQPAIGRLTFAGPRAALRTLWRRIRRDPRTDAVANRYRIAPITAFTIRGHFNAASLCVRLLWHFRTAGRPDVLHLHWSHGYRGAVLAAKLSNIPVVVTEHGGLWPMAPLDAPFLAEPRATLNRADMVLPVSQWLATQLTERGVTSPMCVVPNIVDPEIFFPKDDDPRERQDSKIPEISMVARLEGHPKGIPDAIRAVRRLADQGFELCLQVIGDGLDRVEFETLALELGVDQRVRFVGTKSREQLADILRDSDAFISASHRFETFGVAVAEALPCGLPVVATDVGAISELVTDGINGVLVPASSPIDLAEGIRRVLEQRWNSDDIVKATARLDPEVVGPQLERIYRELLAGRRS